MGRHGDRRKGCRVNARNAAFVRALSDRLVRGARGDAAAFSNAVAREKVAEIDVVRDILNSSADARGDVSGELRHYREIAEANADYRLRLDARHRRREPR